VATPDYNNILGFFALGNVYLGQQRFAEASEVLEKAVETFGQVAQSAVPRRKAEAAEAAAEDAE